MNTIRLFLFPTEWSATLVLFFPDFVIAYPKKYKSYNFSRQECKKQGFSRIGGRACYFTRLFARLPKQQKQPLIIKHLQTYFEKVTKSGEWSATLVLFFFALRRMANCQNLWEVLILLGFFLSIFFMVCLASLTYARMDTHVRDWAKLIAVLATPVVMYAVPA